MSEAKKLLEGLDGYVEMVHVLAGLRAIAASLAGEDADFAREIRELVIALAEEHEIDAHRRQTLRLGELGDGAIEARFCHGVDLVLENIEDIRTDAAAVRKISIEVRIKPDQERKRLEVLATVKTKLAPRRDVATIAFFGRSVLGELVVGENEIPVQMRLPEVDS